MTDQSYNLGSLSMPVEAYSVHTEQKYYSRRTYAMHEVLGRNQAVATGRNTMPADDYLQCILL